jgi:hypothetical protein
MLSRVADRPESLHVANTGCARRLRLTIRGSPGPVSGLDSKEAAYCRMTPSHDFDLYKLSLYWEAVFGE